MGRGTIFETATAGTIQTGRNQTGTKHEPNGSEQGDGMIGEYELSDHVIMKKQHPCGSNEWEIIRMGADIKIKCVQ